MRESILGFPPPVSISLYHKHTQPSSEHLGSFALCFLASASTTAAPSDKLAAVRIEGIKGEVTVMSRAACFPIEDKYIRWPGTA